MRNIALTLLCWMCSFLVWRLNKYTFEHPTTRLVPPPLRHTWFAGLSIILAIFTLCLPGFLTGFWTATALAFVFLQVKFRRRGLELFIYDLKMHKKDKRGLFQHSRNCYMVGGEKATFMNKYLEKHKINPFK